MLCFRSIHPIPPKTGMGRQCSIDRWAHIIHPIPIQPNPVHLRPHPACTSEAYTANYIQSQASNTNTMHMGPGPSIARRKRHSVQAGPSHPNPSGEVSLDLDLDKVEWSGDASKYQPCMLCHMEFEHRYLGFADANSSTME